MKPADRGQETINQHRANNASVAFREAVFELAILRPTPSSSSFHTHLPFLIRLLPPSPRQPYFVPGRATLF